MPKAVSELKERVTEGWVTVRDTGLRGMITLRGDLSDPKLQKICREITGVDFPDNRCVIQSGQNGLCWMSPDEMLLMIPYAGVSGALERLDKALNGRHYMAENVSDARCVIAIEGAGAREVIAKLAPVDLHPDSFGPGEMRRTRLGQVAAAFWLRDAEDIELICFRSVGNYTFELLSVSAQAGPVGVFA